MFNCQECHSDGVEWLGNEVELVFIWAEPVKTNSASAFFNNQSNVLLLSVKGQDNSFIQWNI